MDDLISRQAAIDAMSCINDSICTQQAIDALCDLPSAQPEPSEIARDISNIIENEMDMRVILQNAQPERKNDIIQKFHDYQIEWLKSHYDIELEPQLEEMIVRFLHDTANCYMMEVKHDQVSD